MGGRHRCCRVGIGDCISKSRSRACPVLSPLMAFLYFMLALSTKYSMEIKAYLSLPRHVMANNAASNSRRPRGKMAKLRRKCGRRAQSWLNFIGGASYSSMSLTGRRARRPLSSMMAQTDQRNAPSESAARRQEMSMAARREKPYVACYSYGDSISGGIMPTMRGERQQWWASASRRAVVCRRRYLPRRIDGAPAASNRR